ncbi:hypothetical protein E1B28_010286 [Marasmius oreades]|uniref:Fe2OG dioxygenase domain-containing protein n=1 Tax=Marasmius oreades TaxID=181124 RepID=A0A9P7URL9_9AGAR|nr:uncharacterized protein E1B28_010286 [Marasmius oreades]KAG7091235.1 hypothetical protein E1B28_010286 [Marasmius oreades]
MTATNMLNNGSDPVDSTNRRKLTPWTFPAETKCIPEDQYTDLEVIDLADFREYEQEIPLTPEQTEAQNDLIRRVRTALHTVGFIAVKGHGLTSEDIQHQADIGRLLNYDVAEEEKHRLHARIAQEGSWAGYKPRGYYRRPDGAYDNIQHYDVYPFTALKSRLPEVAQPYVTDIRKFMEYNHYTILRKLLAIISLGLGLERETLWRLHHREEGNDSGFVESSEGEIEWRHSKDHLRNAVYHPLSVEDREKRKGISIYGHTDIGSVSFLYSQPIAGLQLLTPNGEWRYIRHYPNHIIVDLGDSMEFLTGGVLKASPHRVTVPPADQEHLDRLGIFYFVPFLPEVELSLLDHPSLHQLGGKDVFEEYYQLGGKPITSNEWLVMKSKLVGTKRVKREKREAIDVLEDIHFRYNPA